MAAVAYAGLAGNAPAESRAATALDHFGAHNNMDRPQLLDLAYRLNNPTLVPFGGQPGATPYTVIDGGAARTFARFGIAGITGQSQTPRGSSHPDYRRVTPYFLRRVALHRHGMGRIGQVSGQVSAIAAAIQQKEGYYTGSIAYRNNNPGNLIAGPGQTGTSGGFAVFPDYATGLAALDNQIQLNINRGLTLNQFFAGGNGYAGYAPSADSNNPAAYAAFVSAQTGIDPNTPLNQVVIADPSAGTPDTTDASVFDFSGITDALTSINPLWLVGAAAVGFGLVWANNR